MLNHFQFMLIGVKFYNQMCFLKRESKACKLFFSRSLKIQKNPNLLDHYTRDWRLSRQRFNAAAVVGWSQGLYCIPLKHVGLLIVGQGFRGCFSRRGPVHPHDDRIKSQLA